MKNAMHILRKFSPLLVALGLLLFYAATAPYNHSEAEDVYDFALKVEQGSVAEQAGVNRVLALPMFGAAYKTAQVLGYSGRAFLFMIFINRLLAVFSIFLFWKLLSSSQSPTPSRPYSLSSFLCLAFSYGFWRYANEAETYILAIVFVLGAWCLALRGKAWWSVGVSALGVLVHLLNLIPLILIIPLYYLLSRDWKKALLHAGATGLLVVVGYAICSPWLDFSEIGARHHALEGGLGLENFLRGGIAFGQCLVSGNFLFGFDSFCETMVRLFPSRMLEEEFYMAERMAGWIKWAGLATIALLAVCGLWFGIVLCKAVWAYGREGGGKEYKLQTSNSKPLTWAALAWLLLYAVAVVRTEAGSPELWIMALIPFWLAVAALLQGAGGRGQAATSRWALWGLAVVLFIHNLIAGLLPILPASSDYHAAKGRWVVEHAVPGDLILTDYEPVMVFYLDYFAEARIVNSGQFSLEEIRKEIAVSGGTVYALGSFFEPMVSMKARSPEKYARMYGTGQALRPTFEKIEADAFGGIYRFQKESEF